MAAAQTHVTPEAIVQTAAGYMAAKHLFAASELGVFEAVAGGAETSAELAARLGIDAEAARLLADALVATGLLRRDGDAYANTEVTETFLAGGPGPDLRPLLRFWDRLSYPLWQGFEGALRGVPRPAHAPSEEEAEIFSLGVEAITGASAHALAASYPFDRHRRVLDVGGGTGSFLRAVLGEHPHLSGTLFELEETAAVARGSLAGSELEQRIEIEVGDMLADRLPVAHDAFLLANVVHLFSLEHTRLLFERIRAAAEPGARMLLVDFWTDPTHSDPPLAALMAGEFLLVSGEGRAYSVVEVEGLAAETGWRIASQQPLAGPQSLLVAEAV